MSLMHLAELAVRGGGADYGKTVSRNVIGRYVVGSRRPTGGTTLMKAVHALSGAIACLLSSATQAQTVNEDVRCFLLSTGFARAAKAEDARRASAMTGAFYLGRLNGRISQPALAAAIRQHGRGMPAAQAAPIMRACAARAGAAERQIGAAAKQAGTAR